MHCKNRVTSNNDNNVLQNDSFYKITCKKEEEEKQKQKQNMIK